MIWVTPLPLFLLLSYLPRFLLRFVQDIFTLAAASLATITTPVLRPSSQQESLQPHQVMIHPHHLPDIPPPFPCSVSKDHLTVSKYHRSSSSSTEDNCCAVCLTAMEEGRDEVRQLPNCRHVFHMDCIDAWIDKCKTSCPVCRADLLPALAGKEDNWEEITSMTSECGHLDPWRKQRMIYLFGDDSNFM